MVRYYHDTTVNEYWQAENRLVEKGYTTIPFPFHEIDNPRFSSGMEMTLDDVVGLLNTWSATQRFIENKGFNPTAELRDQLKHYWQNQEEQKQVNWKLCLKVGRV